MPKKRIALAVNSPLLPRAFTFLELLTTLAALVIVMGLMVSLARYVRATSADRITRETLRQLDAALRLHPASASSQPAEANLPPVPDAGADESESAAYAAASNVVVRQLLNTPDPVVDAWGNPIGYLPSQDPQIGMAPRNRPFCFSAGPDGRYLTRSDNLYSYEQLQPSEFTPVSVDTAKN